MTETPLGPSPALAAPADGGVPGDEILVAFTGPARQRRLTVLVRIILAIPHLVVLWALGIAAEVVVIIGWFAALFLGRLPASLAEFLSGYLRWSGRVYSYLFLLTDEYPPFELGDAEYPVRVLVRPGPLNRLAVFFRIILAIPAYLLTVLLLAGMETLVMFVTWLIVLIGGQLPRPLHQAIAAGTRYHLRFLGYVFLLTGSYPWGLFGDRPREVPPPYGQPPDDVPPYGRPAGELPPYGQPAGELPPYGRLGAEPPPSAPPWRLVLSGAARGLVGLFLGLGVLLLAAYIAVIAVVASHSAVTKASAALSVENSFARLDGTLATFDSQVSACGGKLSCVNQVDASMARAFTAFAQQMGGKPMPTAASSAAAARVQADAAQIGQDFQTLATASSVSQYQQDVASTGLQAQLHRFDADYTMLGQALGMH